MTNILRIFFIVYYYIISKLAKTFIFINNYIKKLFFYNNYRDITILLSDFIVNLTIVIIIKRNISILKIKLKVI